MSRPSYIFPSSYTGAVTDKGGQVYNVKAYGLDSTGTTACDAAFATITAAIYAAGGGTIYFPPGKYKFLNQITLPTSTPNTALAASASIGAGSIQVNDASGMTSAIGAAFPGYTPSAGLAIVIDSGTGSTETVLVQTGYVPSGSAPYTVPLHASTPLTKNHALGATVRVDTGGVSNVAGSGLNSTPQARQASGIALRLTGMAPKQTIPGAGSVAGSATLDLQWNGYVNDGAMMAAKIDFRVGSLEIDNLTLADTSATFTTATSVYFVGATNGTLKAHDIEFACPNALTFPFSLGTPPHDGLMLGGTDGGGNGGPNSGWNGYASAVTNCSFRGLRRLAVYGAAANMVPFHRNYSTQCGGRGFALIDMVGGPNNTWGVYSSPVYANYFEAYGSDYAVWFRNAQTCSVRDNNWMDDFRSTHLSQGGGGGYTAGATSFSSVGYTPPGVIRVGNYESGPYSVGTTTACTPASTQTATVVSRTVLTVPSVVTADSGFGYIGVYIPAQQSNPGEISTATVSGAGPYTLTLAQSTSYVYTGTITVQIGPFTNTLSAALQNVTGSGSVTYNTGSGANVSSSVALARHEQTTAFGNLVSTSALHQGAAVYDLGLIATGASLNTLMAVQTADRGVWSCDADHYGGGKRLLALDTNGIGAYDTAGVKRWAIDTTGITLQDSSSNTNGGFDAQGRLKAGSGWTPQVRLGPAAVSNTCISDPLTAATAAAYNAAPGTGAVAMSSTGGTMHWNTGDVIYVAFSFTNASGETYFSPTTALTATGSTTTGQIAWGAITALTNATGVKYYASATVNAALVSNFPVVYATGITSAVSAGTAPATNANAFGDGVNAGKVANTTNTGGANPTVALTTCTDTAGKITLTTPAGTGFATGTVLQITYAQAWARVPHVMVCCANGSVGGRLYTTGDTTAIVQIGTNGALSAVAQNGITYMVMG